MGKLSSIKQQFKIGTFTFLFKNASNIHFALQHQRKINRASMNCGSRLLLVFVVFFLDTQAEIQSESGAENYSCRCIFLAVDQGRHVPGATFNLSK